MAFKQNPAKQYYIIQQNMLKIQHIIHVFIYSYILPKEYITLQVYAHPNHKLVE